jgi:hypothetical protein
METMPIHLPPKARAKAAPARRQAAIDSIDSIDWLGLWALSLGFCAVILAGIANFRIGDNVRASGILAGAAAIIAVVVRFGPADDEAGDKN